MSNRYEFLLYALFDLEPMKRFECRSDMQVLRSAAVGESYCILDLLKAFEFGDGK